MKSVVKIRAIVSLFLIILFIIVLISGVGIHVAPPCRVAREIGWKFLGFDKFTLEIIHTWSGFVMSGLIIIHLALNWKTLICEVKSLFRKK